MSASASGPEPRAGSLNAATSRLLRAIAIAATLLFAALSAAAPAWGDDTGGTATVVDSPPANDGGSGAVTPPPNPVDTNAPDSGGSTPTTPDTPPANTPTPPTDVGSVSGGDQGSSTPTSGDGTSGGDDKTQRRSPAHESSGDPTSTSSSPSGSAPSSSSSGTSGTTPPTDPTDGSGYEGDWTGQDNFLVETTPSNGSGGATAGGTHVRFSGLFAFGAGTRATRLEAKERRGHETAKVSALGGGGPGNGGRLPSQNPFFNLLSGPGGAAASMMLLSLLAVIGAAIALPRDRLKRFSTPTVTWRPLAYVPPIELPG